MSLPNYQTLIENMASAIRLVNLYGEHDGHEFIEGSEKIAHAAIQALLKSLPSIDEKKYTTNILDAQNNEHLTNKPRAIIAKDYYEGLLQMKTTG